MKRAARLFVCLLVVLPPLADAQTLDELKHPLVGKGKVAASAEYQIYEIEHTAGAFGSGAAIKYFQAQNVLFPQLRVGVARSVEIRVDATNQFPTVFADPSFAWFSGGGHALSTTTIRALTASVVFRPRANVELRGSYGLGRARDELTYSSTPVIEINERQTGDANVFSVAGTWLSARGAANRPLQADLDGLHHPLLGRRHWAIDGELTRRGYEYDYRSTGDPGFTVDESNRSTDARVWLGVGHGVTNGLEVHADGYWYPAFAGDDRVQTTSTWMGKTMVNTTLSSPRYQDAHGWRLSAVWRPNQRGEMFVEGTREQERVAQDPTLRTGTLDLSRTTTFRFGGTWLSRRPLASAALTANLAGLYHPFVERKQLKLDAFVHRFGYEGDRFVPVAWLWRVQATTGLWPWMQAMVYGGTMSVRYAPSPFTDTSRLSSRWASLGTQATLRLSSRVEAYGSLYLRPAAMFNAYPVFIIGRDDPIYIHRDPFAADLGADGTFHVALRLLM